MELIHKKLSFLNIVLRNEIIEHAVLKKVDKGIEILRHKQYISAVPIVLEGLVKVSSNFEEKELLLYYIEATQSCVMTFFASIEKTPSKIKAATEKKSTILLLPVSHLPKWLKKYPDFNRLFFNQYNVRYLELLDTISHLLVDTMDKRLLDHLIRKLELTNNSTIKMSHSQLAKELGTAREVISRVLKKLELQGKIEQKKDGIKVL